MHFKEFILNENRAYFGQRVGDILNAVADLDDNGKSMGVRQTVRNAEAIVNQIRRILHTNWPRQEQKNLKKLQNAAVAIAKCIDPQVSKAEKDDIYDVIASVKSQLDELSGKLGVPLNPSEPPPRAKEPPQAAPPQAAPPQPPPAGGAAPPMA